MPFQCGTSSGSLRPKSVLPTDHSHGLYVPCKYFSIPKIAMIHLHSFTEGKPMAFGFGSQCPGTYRCSINVDLTGLSIKGVISLISDMSGQERSVFSILFRGICSWAKQKEKLTKHYRCFWREDAVYINIQYILTTTAVSWRSLNIPAVHSNYWVLQIQQENKTKKTFIPWVFRKIHLKTCSKLFTEIFIYSRWHG